jgi:hypothetical protein
VIGRVLREHGSGECCPDPGGPSGLDQWRLLRIRPIGQGSGAAPLGGALKGTVRVSRGFPDKTVDFRKFADTPLGPS